MTHKIIIESRLSNDSSPAAKTVTLEGSSEINIEETVPADSTDLQINAAIDYSALKSLYICATGGDLTLETNSGDTPDDTLTLSDGVPLVWYTGCGHANPFSADVAKFYATEGASVEVTLAIRALMDATP